MILVLEDFISDEDIEKLFSFYKENNDKISEWYGTKTLAIDNNLLELGSKINNFVARFNARLDWGKFVHWPAGSFQPLHLDNASDKTILSSIIYLNDDFNGGETYFDDGTKIAPKKKRALFFDGTKYKHGVNNVENGERFTLATWHKSIS